MPCKNCDCIYYGVSLSYNEIKYKIGELFLCDCGEGYISVNELSFDEDLGFFEKSFQPEDSEKLLL